MVDEIPTLILFAPKYNRDDFHSDEDYGKYLKCFELKLKRKYPTKIALQKGFKIKSEREKSEAWKRWADVNNEGEE